MNRNQNRIEGTYSIVSASRGASALEDFNNTNSAIQYALSKGCAVELVVGFYQDNQELSLRISGINSTFVARNLADVYTQDSFIVVAHGVATLYSGIHNVTLAVWNEQFDGVDAKGNGTMLANGHAFHFA